MACTLLTQERLTVAAEAGGEVWAAGVVRISLEQTLALWLVLGEAQGLMDEAAQSELVRRMRAQIAACALPPRRHRSCERKVRQPVTQWSRMVSSTINQIAIRCRFTGATSLSTEKADFAIPSASDPAILIEVKAYGATGSEQPDVLGDIARIVEQKRHDTVFILVKDGITWKQRSNDLRKLVALQNEG